MQLACIRKVLRGVIIDNKVCFRFLSWHIEVLDMIICKKLNKIKPWRDDMEQGSSQRSFSSLVVLWLNIQLPCGSINFIKEKKEEYKIGNKLWEICMLFNCTFWFWSSLIRTQKLTLKICAWNTCSINIFINPAFWCIILSCSFR